MTDPIYPIGLFCASILNDVSHVSHFLGISFLKDQRPFLLNCVHTKFANAINPLPDIQILGSSNSAANKDMMAKI